MNKPKCHNYRTDPFPFNNGQMATVNASGLFNMHRPTVQYSGFGAIAELLGHGHAPGDQPANDMDILRVNRCFYRAEIDAISPFSGLAHITQIMQGSAGNAVEGGYNTYGSNTLDHADIYPNSKPNELSVFPDVSTNIIEFNDAPWSACNGVTWDRRQWTDYIRFNPDPYGQGIYVTLGIVTWHNSADTDLSIISGTSIQDYTPLSATGLYKSYYWSPPISGAAGFDSDTTDNTFPNWLHTYTNGEKNF